MEDEDDGAAYVPQITAEQARELGSLRLTCFRAFEDRRDERPVQRPLRGVPAFRRSAVNEVLKKDLVDNRAGDKFLSSTVQYVALHVHLSSADSKTDLALARSLRWHHQTRQNSVLCSAGYEETQAIISSSNSSTGV